DYKVTGVQTCALPIYSGSTGFGGLRGGSVRDAIASLEVILPDGSLLKTASQADAGGQLANLTPLFFGAEGTLGIVTKAVLRVGRSEERRVGKEWRARW